MSDLYSNDPLPIELKDHPQHFTVPHGGGTSEWDCALQVLDTTIARVRDKAKTWTTAEQAQDIMLTVLLNTLGPVCVELNRRVIVNLLAQQVSSALLNLLVLAKALDVSDGLQQAQPTPKDAS